MLYHSFESIGTMLSFLKLIRNSFLLFGAYNYRVSPKKRKQNITFSICSKLEPDGTEVELASTLLKLLNCFACFNQKIKS